ncbi:MAG: alpha-L-fucosidase, partial [bacterium]|nr:alpha-L-fucosidase [bacterium]
MKRTSFAMILCAVCALAAVMSCGSRQAAPDPELWKPGQAALERWQDMRFGMFIHWGPVALTGHEIGWSRGRETSVEEYDQLHKKFNPEKFNADDWARAAVDAGMKYVVLTTKHHDGFCLWPSEFTDHDIGETPFGRDVVKELSEACRRQGLKFGTYYSTCDWHHPDFPLGSPGGQTKKPNPNLDRYVEYLRNQVTELITNYGPLSTIWFDVPQEVGPQHGLPTLELVRRLQPDIIVNNRIYRATIGEAPPNAPEHVGDYDTPEQYVGAFNRGRPWETCMTIGDQWAWKPNDRVKSLKVCLQSLIRSAAGDGNLLFNVGPKPDGEIEPLQVERLREMGEWLNHYGDSIYAT